MLTCRMKATKELEYTSTHSCRKNTQSFHLSNWNYNSTKYTKCDRESTHLSVMVPSGHSTPSSKRPFKILKGPIYIHNDLGGNEKEEVVPGLGGAWEEILSLCLVRDGSLAEWAGKGSPLNQPNGDKLGEGDQHKCCRPQSRADTSRKRLPAGSSEPED